MVSSEPMTLRRLKTYTGEQGYVYQYYFVGKREAPNRLEGTAEYIFDVTSDRKTTYAVSVFVEPSTLKEWAASHGRNLSDAEQYAAVKMRLFHAFDEIEDVMTNGRQLFVTGETLEKSLSTLGIN